MNIKSIHKVLSAGNHFIPLPELIQLAKEAPLEECKIGWDFFDEREPRQTMEQLRMIARADIDLEGMYEFIEVAMKKELDAMSNSGRFFLLLCLEYAVRTRGGVV